MELTQIEELCFKQHHNPDQRTHETLCLFSSSLEYLPQCQYVIDNSESPLALNFIGSCFRKLVVANWSGFDPGQRLDIRNYAFNFVANKGTQLELWVVKPLIQLLAEVTRLGWLEVAEMRRVVDEVLVMLQNSVAHCILALNILTSLVAEFSSIDGTTMTGSAYRKLIGSFRDSALLRIFQAALTTLTQLVTKQFSGIPSETESRIQDHALVLVLNCLSYDFALSPNTDSMVEELSVLQVPPAWQGVMEDPATLQLFMDIYRSATAPSSPGEQNTMATVLECMVQLASIRSTNAKRRHLFLLELLGAVVSILESHHGLTNQQTFHQFCRLLSRLQTYELNELVTTNHYRQFMDGFADFTGKALQNWEWTVKGLEFILGVWAHLVSSLPNLKHDHPTLLETYVPQLIQTFVTSRLASVEKCLADDDVPFEDEELLLEQLASIPVLCRFQYSSVVALLTALFDNYLQNYTEYLRVSLTSTCLTEPIRLVEGHLVWLVYLVAAILSGRLERSAGSEIAEQLDGELAARVLQVVQCTELRTDPSLAEDAEADSMFEHLEAALLAFFQFFRKSYLSEGVSRVHASKVFKALTERVGLPDHISVLNVLIAKIVRNLKFWKSPNILRKTLTLFKDITTGNSAQAVLVRLDSVGYALDDHLNGFPFKNQFKSLRVVFMTVLTRLVFADPRRSFETFVAPYVNIADSLMLCMEDSSNDTQERLQGVLCDLRGIAIACADGPSYSRLFSLCLPCVAKVLPIAADVYYGSHVVGIALFKFLLEFVRNRSSGQGLRINFGPQSANGIVLFQSIARSIVAYGLRILNSPAPTHTTPVYRYKAMMLCAAVFTQTIAGNYCNFAIMELYGDRCLDQALQIVLKLVFSIPVEELMEYPKLATIFFQFLNVLLGDFVAKIVDDTDVFARLMCAIERGLTAMLPELVLLAAGALQHILAYHVTHSSEPAPPPSLANTLESLKRRFDENSDTFPRLLHYMLNILIFEENAQQFQWSFALALLPLILSSEKAFEEVTQQFETSAAPEKRRSVHGCFLALRNNVHCNLSQENQLVFNMNVTVFRNQIKSLL
eukprot:gnl/Spiro4/8034_TR4230_c0_g1_i1.p1 gnl/Spiro4/8034_TR4230_c0_g1~~gnl/Spiro4/8034_TR4230_c0_g1_i1.p1  ORF type:complete len:1070 (+),score=209.44 gnl/Spiro4/8034_TR4230_c0_g1_i1:195-3404(+)